MKEELKGWCRLLGVGHDASVSEIKKAYRKKVKELHPDINPSRHAHAQMQDLVEAYDSLIRHHETLLTLNASRVESREPEFDYREFLKSQGTDESRARLLFYDLLHGREDDAVNLFLTLGDACQRTLEHFDREDYMDCGFMIAEELHFRNHDTLALDLLYDISRLEIEKAYFHFFFDDIKELIRASVSSLMVQGMGRLNLVQVERFIHLAMGKEEHAWYFRVMAEFCIKRNQAERALLYLDECRRLDPKIKGVKDLLAQIHKIMERKL